MVTIAEFSLPRDALPLGVVFEEFPETTIELERVVPTPEAVQPYFWVENVAGQTIQDFFEARKVFDDVTLVDSLGDQSLFRCRYPLGEAGLLTALVESGITLIYARGDSNGWSVHVRGDEKAALSAFDERCRGADVPVALQDIHAAAAPSSDHWPAVTDSQREALLLAYERGYYAEPREATLGDLAAEVGISRQAFADRLRRGYRTLIQSHLSFEVGH